MKNKIEHVNFIDQSILKTGYVASIDGAKLQTKQDYLEAMEKALKLPSCHNNWDAYDDWMTDLEWIDDKKIIVIFYHYTSMLSHDSQVKELILDIFETSILPFWEEEVKHVVVGGEPKEFQVYLVD